MKKKIAFHVQPTITRITLLEMSLDDTWNATKDSNILTLKEAACAFKTRRIPLHVFVCIAHLPLPFNPICFLF
jgi:hypothetical protein